MRNQLKKRIALGFLAAFVIGFMLINQAAAHSLSLRKDEQVVPDAVIQISTPPPTPTPYCPETYIELIVDKPMVEVGEIFTLTMIFHNLGQPWVYGVGLTPEGLAVLDPPIDEWPCKLCSVFTLRATAIGRLEIRSGATGERFCNGWMWSGGFSKTPAVVQIVDQVWHCHLPVVSR